MLHNVRVIEIGQAFAGPFSTEILGQLGADVIKIERPGSGDEARRWGPPFWGETAAVFHAINRNKKSLALDLKSEQDLKNFKELVGTADVLVHNLRPGALDKLGLGADAMAQEFPRLIYSEISAYGHTGPLKDLPGYEILAQAFGGVMSITGEPDGNPVRCGPSLCDFGSGMWLAIGILGALYERERTGKGGLVQTSLFETALTWTSVSASSYLASGSEPTRSGASHHLIAPYGYFETKTDPLMIAPASNALFQKLAEALGRPDFINDQRFHDSPSRLKNKALIEGLVGDILKTKDQTHWLNILGNAGVPCSPVNTVPQALNHEQATALGIMQTDPDSADISSIGFPVSFNGKRPKVKQGAPELNSANLSALLNR